MNRKKLVLSLVAFVTFMIMIFMQSFSNAATLNPPKYFGIIPLRNNGVGYALEGDSAKIWNIVQYSSETSNDATDGNVYCLRAGHGAGFNSNVKRATYNVFYDMKAERTGGSGISNSNYSVIRDLTTGTVDGVDKYNAILALGDIVYLKDYTNTSPFSDMDKESFLRKAGIRYVTQNTMLYVESLISQMNVINISNADRELVRNLLMSEAIADEDIDDVIVGVKLDHRSIQSFFDDHTLDPLTKLTDEDIIAIQQAALWYFTNSDNTDYNLYNKNGSWLYETTDGTNYANGNDNAKNADIQKLYKYLVDTAKENAVNYEGITGEDVKPSISMGEVVESGSNYLVGPIVIEANGKNIDSIEITVADEQGIIPDSDYEYVDDYGNPLNEFDINGTYILVPKYEGVNVSVDVGYSDTNLTLYAASTIDEQPILIPERTRDTVFATIGVERKFDLALRKYITKIQNKDGVVVASGSDLAERNPNLNNKIDASTISGNKTTATYKHRKDPITVSTGDIVTYTLTVYNEGNQRGFATQITDQLPVGLEFKRVVSGNFDANMDYSYEGGNKLVLSRRYSLTPLQMASIIDTTGYSMRNYAGDFLDGFDGTNLASEDVVIECEVVATPDRQDNKILTNVAWISEEVNGDTFEIIEEQEGSDIDSEPATIPTVNKNNMADYRGNTSNNGHNLDDAQWYFEGQQDDDDFEKLQILPEAFDLKLLKRITEVNGNSVPERLKDIDVSKLNISGTNSQTTADYKMTKDPVAVKTGDIVTYTFRIFNEGTLDGYASEITEDIPEGLEFLWSEKTGEELDADTTLSAEEKEAIKYNQDRYWVFANSELNEIKTDYLAKDKETSENGNLIVAFGRNDGTKTEDDLKYKEVSVKLKVVSQDVTGNIIRNEAAITEDTDKDGSAIDDRDSDTEQWKKENDTKYYDDNNRWHTYIEDDEDYDNIILQSFDLALRKFIIAVSKDTIIEQNEYLKENGLYTRAPIVYATKLNTFDDNGDMITTAIYNHSKEPVKVAKNDYVVYMMRVFNEGNIDGYASEIKDHLPPYLEFVEGTFNSQYGWEVSDDGRTVTTRYLADQKIVAAEEVATAEKYRLSYKEVPIMCRVKDTAKTNENITNIAEISEYLDENKNEILDRDSQKDNVVLPRDRDLPKYKDDETGDYIPGQQDDDDFEKIIVEKFDLALRKAITSIYNTNTEKERKYNNRYAKLDSDQINTIYDYYDVESNIPTVVENDVVTYSIRIYNEGEVDGKATWVTDRLPSGLEFLPDEEINEEYGWKAFKEATEDDEDAVKIGEKYYVEVEFDSKDITLYATDYLKDTVINAYTGEGEATYKEVFMVTRVKAKSEVEGEYKLRNVAEIGDDDNDDEDSIPGDESEWKDQDDVDIEDLKLVEFDLALRKWVTQAIVIENGKQTVTETGHQPYDDPEQVVKVELNRKKLSQITVKFKYSIRVINEGEIAGYAKEVTDYIPTGLKFVAEDNPGWTDEGNNVISTRLLENTLLQPGEYADVEVILTWITDQNNMGVMTNIAEISEDENEYGVPDKDSTPDNKKYGEDDIDDAPVMLSITTGQLRIYFALGFIVLVTIAGGVTLIKKYVL